MVNRKQMFTGPPPAYNTSQPQLPPAQPAANMYGGATGYNNEELGGGGTFSFSEKSIRMAFIRYCRERHVTTFTQ